MKFPVVKTLVRGKFQWTVNLGKRLTGAPSYSRRYFESKKLATTYYREIKSEITHHGAAFAEFSEPVRAALAKFYALLQGKGLTLEYVAALVEKNQPDDAEAARLSVSEAIERFYDDCKDAALEKSTMREYRSHLKRFEKSFGVQPVRDIKKSNIKTWLADIKVVDRTKKNYITTLRTFFAFCWREEFISKNPAKLVRKPKDGAKTPPILMLGDITKFARYICEHEPKLIAPMAIALFAGIRISELFQLLWSDINFTTREIRVRKEISKKPKQKERWIVMSDNLVAWLSVCPKKEGKICEYPSLDNLWRRRGKAFFAATGKAWPKNGARHSFASYTWTIGRDLKHTANELGNSPQVAQKNYIAGVAGAEGLMFLQIVPGTKAESTKLKEPIL